MVSSGAFIYFTARLETQPSCTLFFPEQVVPAQEEDDPSTLDSDCGTDIHALKQQLHSWKLKFEEERTTNLRLKRRIEELEQEASQPPHKRSRNP